MSKVKTTEVEELQYKNKMLWKRFEMLSNALAKEGVFYNFDGKADGWPLSVEISIEGRDEKRAEWEVAKKM